jgi:hypothetical protein
MSYLADEVAETLSEQLPIYRILGEALNNILSETKFDVKLFRTDSGKLGAEIVVDGLDETIVIISPIIEDSASDISPQLPKP